jgi:RimJ/RimL family protein N-acetyltransferase
METESDHRAMSTVFMESDRLQFRAPELADIETFARWINDPRIRMFLDHRVWPMGLVFEEQWVRKMSEPTPGPRSDVVFVFGKKGEDRILGSSGLHAINWISRDAEWGILIGEEAEWDRGFGREVAWRMLAYAFSSLNLNRVRLRVNVSHARGIRCYEGAGFVREGVLRQASYLEGRYEDQIMMSVLRDDWIQQRLPPPTRPERVAHPSVQNVPAVKKARPKKRRSRSRD